jgi:hypothetical protein
MGKLPVSMQDENYPWKNLMQQSTVNVPARDAHVTKHKPPSRQLIQ